MRRAFKAVFYIRGNYVNKEGKSAIMIRICLELVSASSLRNGTVNASKFVAGLQRSCTSTRVSMASVQNWRPSATNSKRKAS